MNGGITEGTETMSEHTDPDTTDATETEDTEGHRVYMVEPAGETDDTEGHIVRQ